LETSEKSQKKVRQPKAQVAGKAKETPAGGELSAPLGNAPAVVVPAKAAVGGEKAPDARNSEDWIAEVSHELRLPIANIRLLVETLLDGALDDPQTARRMLSRAKGEVDRLQNLVVNLLSIEQVSNARRDVRCELVLLQARAKYAVDTTKKLAAEKGVKVQVQVAARSTIYANPQQLDQVLLNLLENAIKFTPAGGRVVIRAGDEPGSFTVEDTGIGMAAHEIPKIFQRFYRIDRAQTRGSTGLGLSIVKHIADLHGAKISVTSKEGAGSSFSLEFPSPRGFDREAPQ
jgi:two-component system phosphate regulon sensor histidine kinase PhoR